MKLPNNIFDSALDLSKRKYKIICILIILFALMAETAIFTFQSYYDHLEDGVIIDSDCMIASCVAQQLVDQGTSWSTLYTGRYRAYLDILFFVFPILTIGLGTISGYIIGSFLYSLLIIVFACILSIRKKDNQYSFFIILFIVFCLLCTSFFYTNLGHASTYILYAISLIILFTKKLNYNSKAILLTILSILGYLNDDFWILLIVFPMILLFIIQWISEKKVNLLFIPVVLGTGIGHILLKIGLNTKKIFYPQDLNFFHEFKDLSASLYNTIYSICRCFNMQFIFGVSSPFQRIQSLLNIILFLFCIIAFIYACYKIYKEKLSKQSELPFLIISSIVIFIAVYLFVDAPSKMVTNVGFTFRYLYINIIVIFFLLCKYSNKIFITSRLEFVFIILVFSIFIFRSVELVQNKNSLVTQIRQDEKQVVEILARENQKTAYAEWWTAYATWASGENKVQIYPHVTYTEISIEKDYRYVFKNTMQKESHACIIPLYLTDYMPRDNQKSFVRDYEKSLVKQYGMPQKIFSTKMHKILIFRRNLGD